MTARIWTAEPREDYRPPVLGGHRDVVVGGFFSRDGKQARVAPQQAWMAPLPHG